LEGRYAQSVGICVDHRRKNKSQESFQQNVDRLMDYKSRLVVLSRKTPKLDVPQLSSLSNLPAKVEAVSFVNMDEVGAMSICFSFDCTLYRKLKLEKPTRHSVLQEMMKD
jgi:cytoplasmic iron level regulating protein YaaA (DUF328/UPF0246 family)